MSSISILDDVAAENAGDTMMALIESLYPICRSITGNGVRQTLRILQEQIPIRVHEVPTGTTVFDWSVPKEWNIRDAYIKNSRGERVVDFQSSNLHVMSYSIPVQRRMSLAELKQHLFSIPDAPNWIPYRTSYYREDWGFCVTHRQLSSLTDDEYEVCIDSSLEPGHLTYGELLVPGESREEILISCHICHPSLCNDNLSGVALAVSLAKKLMSATTPLRYSYRFVLIPGTIGAITWLARNEETIANIRHGLVLAGVGDSGDLHYKRSRRGDSEIDRSFARVLKDREIPHRLLDFSPYGYDERQYCSPGINLAVGRLSRTPHGTFPEYHTSADDLSFVHAERLCESLSVCLDVFRLLENNRVYVNASPKCEPQLGKRGLYRSTGGHAEAAANELAMLWMLNLSDGSSSLLDIAERSGLHHRELVRVAETLEESGLLKRLEPADTRYQSARNG